VFLLLAGLVIVASVGARLALLARQSYWIDELFSVNESAGSFAAMLRTGATEVHTPLYAALLWVWITLGNTHEVWTRLFSTLCGLAAVVATHRGLRAVPLGGHVRWALTVATAAGGTSLVYSLETRSYTLLLLGSVGLTASTLRAALAARSADDVGLRGRLTWLAWSALAATAHLFGVVLTLAAVLILIMATAGGWAPGRGGRAVTWVLLGAAGCAPQAAWLLAGLSRPGFAAGTAWIQAPDGQDVWDLVTTTFSSGGLTMHQDGFAWTSPAGAVAAAALCLVAAVAGLMARSRPAGETCEARAAVVLLALGGIVTLLAVGVSQWRHLWTLRNMVVVEPALLWGVICLAAAAARTAAGARRVATATVVLLGVGLVPAATGLSRPYKTDFRGLFTYLMEVRAQQPDATFVFLGESPTQGWQTAADRPADDPAWRTLYRHTVYASESSIVAVRRPGPLVVSLYRSSADTRVDDEVADIVRRAGAERCHGVPIHGLAVVHCD
jgi:hypothetical protein